MGRNTVGGIEKKRSALKHEISWFCHFYPFEGNSNLRDKTKRFHGAIFLEFNPQKALMLRL